MSGRSALLGAARSKKPRRRGSPDAAVGLCEVVCRRLRATNERLQATFLMPMGARLARLLLMLAAEDGHLDGAALSQGDLGRLVGASRRKVGLKLNLWVQEEILVKDGRGLCVRNRERLQELAGMAEDVEKERDRVRLPVTPVTGAERGRW